MGGGEKDVHKDASGKLASYGTSWRGLLFFDSLAALVLFFVIGLHNETAYLETEGADAANHAWEDDVIDVMGMALVRVSLLYAFFASIESVVASLLSRFDSGECEASELVDVRKQLRRTFVIAEMLLVGSLAYCLTRLGLAAATFKASKRVDEQNDPAHTVLGLVLLSLGVLFSLVEIVVCANFSTAAVTEVRSAIVRAAAGDSDTSTDDSKDNKKRASLGRLMRLARPEYGLLGAGLLMLVFSSGASIAGPMFFGRVIDAASSDNKKKLNESVATLGLVYAIGALATALRSWLFTLAGQRLVARVRCEVFDAVIRQEIGFFDVTRTGELTNRLASDTQVIQNACTVNISMLARFIAQIFGSILVMAAVSWKLTLVLLSVVPVVAIGAVFYGRKVKNIRKEFQDRLADASTEAEESISSIRTVRSFANERLSSERYKKSIDASFAQGKLLAMTQGGFNGVVQLLGWAAILCVLWYGGSLVIRGDLSTGRLTSFMLYSVSVAVAFGVLFSLYGDFMQALGASLRIFDLLDRQPKMAAHGGETIEHLESTIRLVDVTFTYPSRTDQTVLKNVMLEVPKGTVLALVGPSGGGKSTIVSLMERLYDPDNGVVELGGVDIRRLDPVWMHSKIAMVSQEPTLFAVSIADNIRFGRPTASMEEVHNAAKLANAHGFISQFEDGYETMVGERGVRLSGGQKQRVAIARALLIDPQILLLDEATSALDAESEHLVQEAIERAMRGRTVVVIAHRLSTVREADCVCVINDGEVAETGTHQELLDRDGLYAKLVARQLVGAGGGAKEDTNGTAPIYEDGGVLPIN